EDGPGAAPAGCGIDDVLRREDRCARPGRAAVFRRARLDARSRHETRVAVRSSSGIQTRSSLERPPALVAQLDRAPDFESGGRGFESLRARQIRPIVHGYVSGDVGFVLGFVYSGPLADPAAPHFSVDSCDALWRWMAVIVMIGAAMKQDQDQYPHVKFADRNKGTLPESITEVDLETLNTALRFLFARLREARRQFESEGDDGRAGAFTALAATWMFITLFKEPFAEDLQVPVLHLQQALALLEK